MTRAISGTKANSFDAEKYLVDDMMARYARLAPFFLTRTDVSYSKLIGESDNFLSMPRELV